jgi:hypothetical protein
VTSDFRQKSALSTLIAWLAVQFFARVIGTPTMYTQRDEYHVRLIKTMVFLRKLPCQASLTLTCLPPAGPQQSCIERAELTSQGEHVADHLSRVEAPGELGRPQVLSFRSKIRIGTQRVPRGTGGKAGARSVAKQCQAE